MRWAVLFITAGLAACPYKVPDRGHRYECSFSYDCPADAFCNMTTGFCDYADGGDAGMVDAGDAGDAGMASGCLDGGSPFRFDCFQACSAGCPNPTLCDLATNLCVPALTCAQTCAVGVCVDGVCVTPPSVTNFTPCMLDAGWDGGSDGGSVLLNVTVEALQRGMTNLVVSSIRFFQANDLPAAIPATRDGGAFSVALPPGMWTALVEGPGIPSTFFPGLWIIPAQPYQSALDLNSVVPPTLLPASYVPTPGRWIWAGTMTDCSGMAVAGYTVGISPLPSSLYYCTNAETNACVPDGGGDSSYGTFLALDVPENTDVMASIAVDIDGGPAALVNVASFNEQDLARQLDGGSDAGLAVALIYPFWNQ